MIELSEKTLRAILYAQNVGKGSFKIVIFRDGTWQMRRFNQIPFMSNPGDERELILRHFEEKVYSIVYGPGISNWDTRLWNLFMDLFHVKHFKKELREFGMFNWEGENWTVSEYIGNQIKHGENGFVTEQLKRLKKGIEECSATWKDIYLRPEWEEMHPPE